MNYSDQDIIDYFPIKDLETKEYEDKRKEWHQAILDYIDMEFTAARKDNNIPFFDINTILYTLFTICFLIIYFPIGIAMIGFKIWAIYKDIKSWKNNNAWVKSIEQENNETKENRRKAE